MVSKAARFGAPVRERNGGTDHQARAAEKSASSVQLNLKFTEHAVAIEDLGD
jgi:hypothetical protein